MQDEITIPARYGARVYVNQSGGVSLVQQQEHEELLVMLSPDEAQQVAEALSQMALQAQQAARETHGGNT